jgi:uncharacterized protein YegL
MLMQDRGDFSDAQLDRAIEILNGMYDTEQSDLDLVLIDCKHVIDGLKAEMDENSRARTFLGESAAQARAEQLESSSTKKEAEEQLEDLKERWESYQASCAQTLAAKDGEYKLAKADYEVGQKIQEMTKCDSAAKAAAIAGAALLQNHSAPATSLLSENTILSCHGSAVDEELFMFGAHRQSFTTAAARFAAQRAAKLALQRKLGKHAYNLHPHHPHIAVLLSDEEDPETPGKGPPPADEVSVETTTTPAPVEELAPGYKCNVNAVPNCPLLADAVSSMVGELRDAFVRTRTAYEEQDKECKATSADFEAQIKDWTATHDRAEVKLAEAVTDLDSSQSEMHSRALEYADLEDQLTKKQDECKAKQFEIMNTMCGIKVIRLQIFQMSEKDAFFADCEVGDWVPQECSVSCAGGSQVLTREVLAEASYGAPCPPLEMEQECNTQPCPVDCEMNDWSGWSACSKDCGGGVMSRSRIVQRESEFGGEECGAVSDAQMCNADACNVPCELGDWLEWGSCTKACNGGIEERRRPVVVDAKGTGDCAAETSDDRYEMRPCNDHVCPSNLVCDQKMDLMLLMDGSGSVGAKGFELEKEFAEYFLKRNHMGEEAVKAGVILFSYYIEVRSVMTTDVAALTQDVAATEWQAYNTNTASALSRALDVMTAGGRSDASSVVFVLTDGMPNDSEATAAMAAKVKERARLVFLAVGKNLDMDALYEWASFPPEFNVLSAKKFKELTPKLGEFLSDVCPSLKCSEASTGNGADYIGCQDRTVSGKQCQKWTDKVPHKHKFLKSARQLKRGLGDFNYCRNPDQSSSIWCYTNDPTTPWEACAPLNTTDGFAPYVPQ